MMVNCPKCKFLQDKDQYCANCGVNMETWKPPKTPFSKKLLSNWIFQLSVLFIIVLALVIVDSFSAKQEVPEPESYQAQFDSEEASSSEPEAEEVSESSNVSAKPQQVVGIRSNVKTAKLSNSLKRSSSPEKAKPVRLNNRVYGSVHLIPRAEIETLLSLGQKVEDNVGHIPLSTFEVRLKQSDPQLWKNTDSIQKRFSLNKPKVLFSGERTTENNIGFYFEVTVFDTSDLNNISLEVKIWSELKGQKSQEEPFSYELSVPYNHVVLISGFAPRDLGFSDEERAFFEASETLLILNNDNFIEDYSDIALVLELN